MSEYSTSNSELIQNLVSSLVQRFCNDKSKYDRMYKFIIRIISSRLGFSLVHDELSIVQMMKKYCMFDLEHSMRKINY